MRKHNRSGQCLGTAGRGIFSERHPSLDSSLRTGRKVTANIDSQLLRVNRAVCSDAWRKKHGAPESLVDKEAGGPSRT